jgi:hypothetical protein
MLPSLASSELRVGQGRWGFRAVFVCGGGVRYRFQGAVSLAATPRDAPKGTPLDAVRAFGVVLGGPIVLDLAVAASALRTVLALARRRAPPPLALAALAAAFLYALRGRRWLLAWGATEDELRKPLPGDELVPNPGRQSTRAVTVEAPVEEVWPWLAQIGQDRGGFYSYEWLENLAGCHMRNAERIHPEWQRREVGETVLLHPANGLKVARFETGRALVLEEWGAFVLEPVDEQRTRLIVRGRIKRGLASVAYAILLELPHFVMERKMLLGIKERAEWTPKGESGGVRHD